MVTLDQEILDSLKNFEWHDIIAKGNQLEDLNSRQWRFTKGFIIELIVEKHSGLNGLIYVGENHKDYDWPFFNKTVELKSGLSGSMYCKTGQLRENFTVKFNNSNGTNKKDNLDPIEVADILLVVKNDGAFVVDKDTVIRCARKGGDGFEVKLFKTDFIELTGKITIYNTDNFNLKEILTNAIKEAI